MHEALPLCHRSQRHCDQDDQGEEREKSAPKYQNAA